MIKVAARIKVTAPRVVAIQQSEITGAITLKSLERAADALGCQLVYALVPRTSLQHQVEERALELARQQLATTQHTMALEDQRVSDEDDRQLVSLTRKLVAGPGKILWDKF